MHLDTTMTKIVGVIDLFTTSRQWSPTLPDIIHKFIYLVS